MNLRLATMDDAARLYHWRMDPATAEASTTKGPAGFVEHLKWLEETLDRRPEVWIWIGVDTQRSVTVGFCRFDNIAVDIDGYPVVAQTDLVVDVSVAVDPEQRNRTYAAQLIALAADKQGLAKGVTLRARVKPSNFASLRLFWGLGFRLTAEDNGILVLEMKRP